MPEIPPQQKKKILADPVTLFSHHHPQETDEQLAALHALAQQYSELEVQHGDLQKKTRQLSRLIGDARKNEQSVDDLMTSMQQHSKRLKTLAGELTATGNHILDYFEAAEDAIWMTVLLTRRTLPPQSLKNSIAH